MPQGGTPLYNLYRCTAPNSMVFEPFWSESGYEFWTFWPEIGYFLLAFLSEIGYRFLPFLKVWSEIG